MLPRNAGPGRRKGRVWVRQGQGGGEAVAANDRTMGRRKGPSHRVPQMERLCRGGILWQKNATSPGPREEKRPERSISYFVPQAAS